LSRDRGPLVVVTGATGHIGGALSRDLLATGRRLRVIAREQSRLEPLAALGAEACAGDLHDPGFLTRAFAGADAVFAMIPPSRGAADVAREFRQLADNLADALLAAGVRRVVALHGLTPQTHRDPVAALHHLDQRLRETSGLAVAALRPGFFMENLLPSVHAIRRTGALVSAHRPDLPVPMVATRDIAAAAARLLRALDFEGYSTYELMGAQDYTFEQAARILGAAIGRPDLQYRQCGADEFHASFLRAGFSESAAHFHVELARLLNAAGGAPARAAANTTATTLEWFAAQEFAPAFERAAGHASKSNHN
jgi:uncharacterized protein YbjT (DUF2867 family)